MAQGLELAIDLHIHEVFSKVGLPEQTTKIAKKTTLEDERNLEPENRF